MQQMSTAKCAACRHAPYCLQYLEKVKDRQNFRFCAIPQVMAIGTLALCYNNPEVFTGKPCVLITVQRPVVFPYSCMKSARFADAPGQTIYLHHGHHGKLTIVVVISRLLASEVP